MPHCAFFLSLTPDLAPYVRAKLPKKFSAHIDPGIIALQKLDPKTEILGIFVDSKNEDYPHE